MNDFTTFFTDLLNQWHRLPVAAIWGVFILFVGLLVKSNRVIPNKWIPMGTLLLGAFGYAALGNAQKVTCVEPGWRQYAVLGVYGAILGFVVWGAHRFLLHRLEKFLPEGFFPAGSFDTDPPFPIQEPTKKEVDMLVANVEKKEETPTKP